jgi:hypothetical protein
MSYLSDYIGDYMWREKEKKIENPKFLKKIKFSLLAIYPNSKQPLLGLKEFRGYICIFNSYIWRYSFTTSLHHHMNCCHHPYPNGHSSLSIPLTARDLRYRWKWKKKWTWSRLKRASCTYSGHWQPMKLGISGMLQRPLLPHGCSHATL